MLDRQLWVAGTQNKQRNNQTKKKMEGGGGLEINVRDSVYSLFYTNSQPQKKKHGKKKTA